MDVNDTNDYSNDTADFPPGITTFEFVTEGVLLTILGILGIFGNLLSSYILSRPEMRSSVNCGLQALACFDTIVLVSSVTMLGLHKLGFRVAFLYRYSFEAFPFVVLVAYPIGLIAQTGSVWTTVGVTVERFVAVCHPLKARWICTYRRARVVNLIIFIFSVLYNIPRFMEIDVGKVLDPTTNKSLYVAQASEFRQNKLYYNVYYVWCYLFIMYFIPFMTLAALNVCIWRTVRFSNRNRRNLTRREEKEIGLAMMLICVVAVFFVCNILALVINIFECFDLVIPSLVRVSNLLVTLNSSVNFIIYCIFGQKFKKLFLNLLCYGRSRPNFGSTMHMCHHDAVHSDATVAMHCKFRSAKSFSVNGASESSSL